MHMNLREVDWRIEPLYDVIVGIDAGLAAIQERLDTVEWFDDATYHAETLFGLGFVAAQSYALGTVSDLNTLRMGRHKPKKNKLECYACDSIKVKGAVTRVELINACANYFKHHDEWERGRWPTSGRGAHDTKTLRSVDIIEKTPCTPCIDAVDLLCGTTWKLIVLHQIVQEWRAHLFSKLL